MTEKEKETLNDLESLFFEIIKIIQTTKSKTFVCTLQDVFEFFAWKDPLTKKYSLWIKRQLNKGHMVIILTGNSKRCRISTTFTPVKKPVWESFFDGVDTKLLRGAFRDLQNT